MTKAVFLGMIRHVYVCYPRECGDLCALSLTDKTAAFEAVDGGSIPSGRKIKNLLNRADFCLHDQSQTFSFVIKRLLSYANRGQRVATQPSDL